jgi:hypothetical protein
MGEGEGRRGGGGGGGAEPGNEIKWRGKETIKYNTGPNARLGLPCPVAGGGWNNTTLKRPGTLRLAASKAGLLWRGIVGAVVSS